ncbi:hypothetical protein ILYODFUR_020546 [Ilyodon furcidens]|uniref:Uncharacterized protein n=1 Tax=Ilyodon furcidens TaxID=33524 RepID=A0ABV0UAV3_9TELE
MPEPPQLAPLDVEGQRLYSKVLPDGGAPHPISKGVPSHPMEEAHFSCFYPGFRSFSYDAKFMVIGQGRNVDRPVNESFAFWLSSFFTTTDRHSLPITVVAVPICLSISHSILPSFVNKTPRYLNSST